MKLLAILCLAGLAFASRGSGRTEWLWESEKEYVYSYSGRLLTGIPELADVYSGIGINCTVHLQVAKGEENSMMMVVRNPKYVRVNEELETVRSDGLSNWRELRLPELSEVSGEYLTFLTQPIMFTMTNGEITSAKVSKNEPTWSLNFKKALALHFQTKLEISSQELNNDLNERLNSESEVESSDEGITYWKVKEETIDGVCENIYEVRKIPKYMVVDRPEMVPYPEACSEEKYYGLTKTKDVGKCEKRSSFNYMGLGHFGYQLTGNNMNMWGRSSSTRYIACGSRGRLTIQSIINDGELNQNLLGYKTERFVTGTLQVFHLKEVRPASNVEMVGETITIKSMMFEHSTESYKHSVHSPLNNLNQEERLKNVQEGRIPSHLNDNPEVVRQALPRNFFYGIDTKNVQEENIKSQLKSYISEMVHELIEGVDTRKKEITSKVLAVSRGFSMLKSKEDIESVYEELKSEFSEEKNFVTMRNIFFDTLITSGCPKAVYFIKEKIMSGEMTNMQVASFFIWMPTYVRMPTKEVLNSLYELVTSDKIRENKGLYNKAIMGFSTLLQKSCVSNYRKTTYPIHVFGEFCNPDSEIVVSKWIPYLVHDLKYSKTPERRNEIIVSLGLMQHKSIIRELIPFIEGTVEGTTKLNRYLALYSLCSVAESRDPTHVIPIFFSVLSNPAESTTLRIAAFNCLLRMNPSMAVMHKIAALTWTIRDEEVLKVINIALFTLSKETELEMYDETTLTLPKKAFLVFPLIKKTPGILPSSATVFTSERLPELGIGYDSQTSWISSNTSFVPRDFYTEMTYFLDQFRFTALSFGVRLNGAETIYHQIKKLLKPYQSEVNREEEQSSEGINQEWEQILEQLKLKVREDGPLDGAMFLRWFESSPMFYNFDKFSPEDLRHKISQLLSNPEMIKEKLCGEFPLNFQQTMDRSPHIFMVASDMGFPIVIEIHLPIAFSIRGSLNVRCESAVPSVTYEATIVSNAQYSGWVGTTIPFTKEYTVTGVQEQFAMNIPARLNFNLDIPSGKISITGKLLTGSLTKPTDLMYYHVKPFTSYKKIVDLTPLTLSPNVKYISSGVEPKKIEFSYGEYFGLDMKYRVITESPYTDTKSFLDILKMYKYNPLNVLRFSWTIPALTESGKPSLRMHSRSLVLDPSSSSTKEFQFDIKIGCGEKVKGEQNVKYHMLKLKNPFQNQNRVQNQHRRNHLKMNPFEVDTQDVDSHTQHPRRQQKVKQALQNLNVETGYAVTIVYTFTLKGSRPHSVSNTVTLAAGRESHSGNHGVVRSKWDFKMERDTTTSCPLKNVCIKGSVDLPILPMWNIEELRSSLVDLRYNNEIGFGESSCSDSTIKVVGNAKVSHEQKEFSRQSDEARKCHKLLEERVPGAKLSDACERTRLQAQTVDEVEFKVVYNNMPSSFSKYETTLLEYLRMYLWPYLKDAKMSPSVDESVHHKNNYAAMARILFHRETPSFDLILNRPSQSIAFSRIRIPYPLNVIFPMKAGRNNAYLAVKAITGEDYTPECKIGTESLTTFDNKTMSLEMDDCFHLLSGDCSKDRSFGILARNMKPDKTRRELKVFLGEVALVFTPSEMRNDPYFADIRVTVESEELTMPANSWKNIVVHGQKYGSLFRSSDNVFQLKSSEYNAHFLFDGSRVVIYASNLLKSKLCGICGNFNQVSKDDMVGPAKCFHNKPETLIASYRVQSEHCNTLSEHVQRELQEEKQQCLHYKEIPTQVLASLKAQTGECTVRKHIVIERSGEICLSKTPCNECSSGCKVSGDMVVKSVPFVCLPPGRLADLYVQKANDGQEIEELKPMTTTFETKVEQPKKCVSSILKDQN